MRTERLVNVMKKSVFSPRLYLDGLKQLRLIGIAALVIMSLEAILIPVGKVLSQKDQPYIRVQLLDFIDIHPILFASFCVLAPLMTLYLFQFLNRRNASDFYHAIPETRLCLFFSFIAAILTWVMGTAVVTTGLAVGFHVLFPAFFVVNFCSVLTALFNILSGCVLVTACVALAMCVTGTLFTNVMVSLMLIFVPRLLILFLNVSVTEALPLIPSNHFVFLLDSSCNVPVGAVLGALGLGTFSNVVSSLGSGLYTLVLGMLYLAAGAVLFHRRRSEAAGQAAPNRILQAAYRLALAMIPCAFACYGIFHGIVWKEEGELFSYVVIYIIALVVYFLYEIITTRKWKNLLRAIPVLGVLAVLNVALIGGMVGLYHSVLSFSPGAEDITSIRIVSPNKYTDYFTARAQEIEIKNLDVNQVVARQLSYTVDVCRSSPRKYYTQYSNMTTACVAIRTGASVHYRNILMSAEDYQALSAPLAEIPAFREIYQKLPRLGYDSTTVTIPNRTISRQAVQEIYQMMCDEVAALPFEQWYAQIVLQKQGIVYSDMITSSQLASQQYAFLDTLRVSTTIGTQQYSFSLPLFTNLTQSCNRYLRETQEQQKSDADKILSWLEAKEWRLGDNLNVEAYNLDGLGSSSASFSLSGEQLRQMPTRVEEFAGVLRSDEVLDITKPLYRITLDREENAYYGEEDYYYPTYVTYTAFFQASSAEIPSLLTGEGENRVVVFTEESAAPVKVISFPAQP